MQIKSSFYYKSSTALLSALLLMLVSACKDDGGDSAGSSQSGISCTELIYCHPDDEETTRKVVEYALSKINEAQQGLSFKVNLNFEYASDSEDHFATVASSKLLNGQYGIVIAPSDVEKAEQLLKTAQRCYGKSYENASGIIFPSMTSNEVQRTSSSLPYVYNMASDDRSSLLIALEQMHSISPKYVNLVCTDDDYGKTFSRFFSLYSSLAGYTWVGGGSVNSITNGLIEFDKDILREHFIKTLVDIRREFCDSVSNETDIGEYATYIVASSNPEHGVIVDSLVNAWSEQVTWDNKADRVSPRVIIINPGNSQRYDDKFNNVCTYNLSPNPSYTEFASDFYSHFGYYPVHGEAFIYDSVLMAFYAEYARMINNNNVLGTEGETRKASGAYGLMYVTKGNDDVKVSWSVDGIRNALQGFLSDKSPKLSGTTSDWEAENPVYYSVLWFDKGRKAEEKQTPLFWICNDSENNLTVYNNLSDTGWEPQLTELDEISSFASLPKVPELDKRWALLIAGTCGTEKGKWGENYRHQGDVWNMYHLLRNKGYDDNHIIVVTEDDIFGAGLFGESAGEKVVKCVTGGDGENLYEEIKSHYRLTDLTQQDIADIISGKKSEKLPYVIESTSADDVLIYWSGHGNADGALRWDGQNYDDDNGVMEDGLMNAGSLYFALQAVKHRRMLFLVEACHSGNLIIQLPQVDNVLYMAAAEDESSWSDTNNIIRIQTDGGASRDISVFDDFSAKFVETVRSNPKASLYAIFKKIYDSTSASHPTTYNADRYGSLFNLSFYYDYWLPE